MFGFRDTPDSTAYQLLFVPFLLTTVLVRMDRHRLAIGTVAATPVPNIRARQGFARYGRFSSGPTPPSRAHGVRLESKPPRKGPVASAGVQIALR